MNLQRNAGAVGWGGAVVSNVGRLTTLRFHDLFIIINKKYRIIISL